MSERTGPQPAEMWVSCCQGCCLFMRSWTSDLDAVQSCVFQQHETLKAPFEPNRFVCNPGEGEPCLLDNSYQQPPTTKASAPPLPAFMGGRERKSAWPCPRRPGNS